MRLFLARWARRLSWKETAHCFRVPWDTVHRSVAWVVDHGLRNRDLGGVAALGIDEVAYGVGHRYMTPVYQIGGGPRRLLGVVEGRTIRSILRFLRDFGRERCALVKVVCTDMWHPYLKVVAKKLPSALNVLDRFHIVAKEARRGRRPGAARGGCQQCASRATSRCSRTPATASSSASKNLTRGVAPSVRGTRRHRLTTENPTPDKTGRMACLAKKGS
ncbi:hypothetical protein BH23VER1_BH23VER1_08810 [soil metagenome]